MIMAGYEYKHDMPFRNVYFTGIVRDKIGRKMSKSLGNSPDPLELIEKYGADGVRMGMMLSAPAGNDILFDDALCEQGRNFNNKIWNAFRLVKGWNVADIEQPEYARIATEWFKAMLAKTTLEVTDLFGKYRLSEALMAVYKLFWDEFSSWYLEMVKPAYGQPIDRTTYEQTLKFFEALLMQLHPFMPFITEELWQHIYDRQPGESIMTQQLDKAEGFNEALGKRFREGKRSHRRHPHHPLAKEHCTERNPGFGSGWSKSGIRIQFYPGKDGKPVRYPYGRSKSRRRSGLHGRYYRICRAIGQPHQCRRRIEKAGSRPEISGRIPAERAEKVRQREVRKQSACQCD